MANEPTTVTLRPEQALLVFSKEGIEIVLPEADEGEPPFHVALACAFALVAQDPVLIHAVFGKLATTIQAMKQAQPRLDPRTAN